MFSAKEGRNFPGVRNGMGRLPSFFVFLIGTSSLMAIPPGERLADLTFSRWGAPNGIPEETFAALLAPGDGYVWLASNHGLVRFDGARAKVFRLGDEYRPKGTGSCSSSTLNSLTLGPDGQIWVGGQSGCVFHVRQDRFGGFSNFQLAAMQAPDGDRESTGVIALWPHPDGWHVEVARRSGVGVIATETMRSKAITHAPPDAIPATEHSWGKAPGGQRMVLSSRGEDGRIWIILSDGRLFARRETEGEWQWMGKWQSDSDAKPLRLLAGRSGGVWIGTNQGLVRWKDGQRRNWGVTEGLAKPQVLALHEDGSGCLWIGATQSVARLCGERLETLALGIEEEEIFSAIAEDPQGNIWLGGRWGNLYRLGPAIFRNYTRREGLPESHLTGVTVDGAGHVWGSTRESGLVRITEGRVAQHTYGAGIRETQAVVGLPEGGALAASALGVFRVREGVVTPIRVNAPIQYRAQGALAWEEEGRKLLYSNSRENYRLHHSSGDGEGAAWRVEVLQGPTRMRQWAKDTKGRIWALAQFEGLQTLEGSRYRPARNGQPERARAWYSIIADRKGLLWIGTTDGMEVYSTEEERFLTERPLLFGDQIFHISEDAFGKIWCATRRGLVRLGREEALAAASNAGTPLYVERFGESNSLPTTNFGLVTSATGATGKDGRIWFPGLLGLVSLQPADFERVPRPATAVLLQVNRDGIPQDLNRPLWIAPGSKTVEFLFQTLRLDPLGGDFCRVRLQGFDPDWHPCNEARAQQYTKLVPGEYEFIVQTSSQGGVWNGRELRAPIAIAPAFHELRWVRLLGGAALLTLLGFGLWRRQRQLLERTRELEDRVEERTATLAQATQAAQAANRAKSEFLATMSHEIRTPMNGVLGAVQILDGSPLNGEQRELVSVIRQSSEDMVGIVDDILSLARVEAGKLSLERVTVDVAEIGESLVALFQPKAAAKGVALELEISPETPPYILSDPQRIRQMLLNLVGNAVKFTEHGVVRLQVSADPTAKQITFQVTDTGMGIPAEKLPMLFQPFVQVDSSTTRRFGGSGLGLSIVQRFADAMGGTVTVDSQLGRGSAFRLTLPYEEGTRPAPAPETELRREGAEGVGLGTRVLLAEDNPVNQMIFQKMLRRLGCEVVLARNGLEALEALRAGGIDMVFMDCQMPELDGLEATRVLRRWGGDAARLPVVALTASAMDEDREKCFAAGMDDFLSKPLLFSALEATVARWVVERRDRIDQ